MPRWLARLLGYVPADEREGIRLEPQPHWEVSPPEWAQVPPLLRLLPALMPPESVLYLEGHPAPPIRAYLEEHADNKTAKVAMGTIWPRPLAFHLPLTAECAEGLARLVEPVEEYLAPAVAHHLHVYRDAEVMLEWYDFPSDPFWVSKAISAEAIADLCTGLGLRYEDRPGAG